MAELSVPTTMTTTRPPRVRRMALHRAHCGHGGTCTAPVTLRYVNETTTRLWRAAAPAGNYFLYGRCSGSGAHVHRLTIPKRQFLRCSERGCRAVRADPTHSVAVWEDPASGHLFEHCTACQTVLTTPYACVSVNCSSPAVHAGSMHDRLPAACRFLWVCQADFQRRIDAAPAGTTVPAREHDHPIFRPVRISNDARVSSSPSCRTITVTRPPEFFPDPAVSRHFKCPWCGQSASLRVWARDDPAENEDGSEHVPVIQCTACACFFEVCN